MTDSQDTKTDGGRTVNETLVDLLADQEVEPASRQERLKSWFFEYVIVTLRIIWDDIRARIGIGIILMFILIGTVGPSLVKKPALGEHPYFIGPFQSWDFILGTTGFGQDIAAQLVYATPAMLKMAFSGAVLATALAVIIGTTAGYKGGRIDTVLMSLTDIVLTMPGLPLIVIIAAVYPPRNPFVVGFLLAIDNWPGLARKLRSQVLTLREESYVEASRTMGFASPEILRRDIVPQLMPYITINASAAARGVIFESVGLYYLGILPFTTFNWGVMMQNAQSEGAVTNPGLAGHWLWWPMLTLLLMSIGLILFSQGMDRIFNPRLRARHAKLADTDDDEEPIQPDIMD